MGDRDISERPLLFLDIDAVLNSTNFFVRANGEGVRIVAQRRAGGVDMGSYQELGTSFDVGYPRRGNAGGNSRTELPEAPTATYARRRWTSSTSK